MCMKGTTEGCILLERVAKVEAKQYVILGMVVFMFLVVAFIAIKLLNAQIYMLTGDGGLRTVTNASRIDAQTLKQISGAVPGTRINAVAGAAKEAAVAK